MIRVTVGNNLKRNDVNIDPHTTLRAALESNGVDISTGVTTLDSSPLGAGDLNKTFFELGYTGDPGHDKAFLLNVAKAQNA